MRPSKFSLNRNQASSAVRTASRFSSNDADAAVVNVSPYISAMGPTTPPSPMAAPIQVQSLAVGRATGASVANTHRAPRTMSSPSPAPRYRSAASHSGGIDPTSVLANGVLTPKSTAEAMP